jgi:hypothetical protein
LAWADRNMDRMQAQDAMLKSNMVSTLMTAGLSHDSSDDDPLVVFTTNWSGAGAGEAAAVHVQEKVLNRYGSSFKVVAYSSCDNDPIYQKVLKAHVGASKPLHLFQNILDRMPAGVFEQCLKLLVEALDDFKQLKTSHTGSQSHPPTLDRATFRELKDVLSKIYLESLDRILSATVFEEKALCVLCEDYCYISPRTHPKFRLARWNECSGHTCTPWSAMGAQSNALDAATLPTMV